jgi:serine/threonine protein kinase
VERFEHYDLVEGADGRTIELGRGGMGVTYKAFDVHLRCPVALKIISEALIGDQSARLRFVREARAAASVRHPNLASTPTRWSLSEGRRHSRRRLVDWRASLVDVMGCRVGE